MTATTTLQTLLDHAERERNEAMAEAKRVELEHRAAARQADQLLGYRQDYEARWSSHFKQGEGIAIMQCYQGFVTRLDQAIEAQARVTALAAQRVETAQTAWQAQEMRVAAVRKLIERRELEQRAAGARQEQRQLDEHAARVQWGRSAGGLLSHA